MDGGGREERIGRGIEKEGRKKGIGIKRGKKRRRDSGLREERRA